MAGDHEQCAASGAHQDLVAVCMTELDYSKMVSLVPGDWFAAWKVMTTQRCAPQTTFTALQG